MSNDPRPRKPPLPLLKRPKSGAVPATHGEPRESVHLVRPPRETGRSGTIPAVRPATLAPAPRPTNVLRGLEKSSPSVLKSAAAERQGSAAARVVRREPVLRRLDPTFTSDDSSGSWEPKGTLAGVPYRDSMPTLPSPEELESRLLAELAGPEAEAKPTAAEPRPTPVSVEPSRPGARAQFAAAHTPAVSISPIIELDKAVPVIVDPLDLVGRAPAVPEALPAPQSRLPESEPRGPAQEAEATPALEAAAAEVAIESDSAGELVAETPGTGRHEPEVSERSRITLPPARRARQARRRVRALLLAMAVLGGLAGVAWYRYPVESAQGLQRARAELTLWSGVLEHQWSLGLRALGR